MKGSASDENIHSIYIRFKLCNRTESLECAPEEEVQAYLADKIFFLFANTNYIDMKEVLKADETLKKLPNYLLETKIDLEKPQSKVYTLEEHRTELQDDSINFMGLTEPKEINYLNFAEVVRDVYADSDPLVVAVFLSQKVTIQ